MIVTEIMTTGATAHPSRPRAVMFDMTGTLHPQADIAVAAVAATHSVLDHHRHLALAEVMPVVTRSIHSSFTSCSTKPFYLMRDMLAAGHRQAWPALGVTLDEHVLEQALDMFERTLVAVIQPYPSVPGVLAAIRAAGIATAIVSVNDEQLLQDSVDACGFRDQFDLVLSSEAARSCKPHPKIYEHAMAALGVAPHESVFVGDMPALDIAGANRLGMRTVLTTEDNTFFGDAGTAGPDCVAHHVIATLADLPPLLGLA